MGILIKLKAARVLCLLSLNCLFPSYFNYSSQPIASNLFPGLVNLLVSWQDSGVHKKFTALSLQIRIPYALKVVNF